MYEFSLFQFEIHFRRRFDSKKDFTKVGFASTIAEAKKLRKVTGDLIVHAETHEVVKSRVWLWDFELKDPNCYAQKAIKNAIDKAY